MNRDEDLLGGGALSGFLDETRWYRRMRVLCSEASIPLGIWYLRVSAGYLVSTVGKKASTAVHIAAE
jgi:hypothetical protein